MIVFVSIVSFSDYFSLYWVIFRLFRFPFSCFSHDRTRRLWPTTPSSTTNSATWDGTSTSSPLKACSIWGATHRCICCTFLPDSGALLVLKYTFVVGCVFLLLFCYLSQLSDRFSARLEIVALLFRLYQKKAICLSKRPSIDRLRRRVRDSSTSSCFSFQKHSRESTAHSVRCCSDFATIYSIRLWNGFICFFSSSSSFFKFSLQQSLIFSACTFMRWDYFSINFTNVAE
jgi:hypothetical protein